MVADVITSLNDPEFERTGQIIDGKYRIDTLIGAGTMGLVHRAIHLPDGTVVAIKFVANSMLADTDLSLARFRREARVIGKLKHPNILQLHGYGQHAGLPYLAMQYIGGGDLNGLLHKERLDLEITARLLDQMASALDYAHAQQVIHRDIKPANVLLDEQQNAILADFGLARLEEVDGSLTASGILVGTPAYMAPELAGEGRLLPSVDLYALACILYQMLTNELPFQADTTVGFLLQHIGASRPDVRHLRPDLPSSLTLVMQRALARDVADRYPSGAALARAFRDGLTDEDEDGHSITTISLNLPDVFQSPFKGLEAFQEADAPYFFGREALVEHLVERLRTPDARFLAVLGASGSGKSSLVRAGLIPALRKNSLPGSVDWPILIFTPGAQPLQALAAPLKLLTGIPGSELVEQIENDPEKLSVFIRLLASRQPDQKRARVALVIDQFEEVFTRASDHARDTFLNVVLHAATAEDSAAVIVLTMRADFYHRVTSYPDPRLADLFQTQQVIARPMTAPELRYAIEAPVSAAGLHYEGGLVEEILADIGHEPGSLPLLQYALQELFQERQGLLMTRDAYDMTGGVQGALARRAENVFNELDKGQQLLARRILLRLVEVNAAGEITRRRVERDQLVFDNTPDEDVEEVLEHLLAPEVRLLTANREWQTGVQWIDVSHEALIQRWERLQGWVRENLSSLLLGGHLLKAAQEWQKNQRDPGYLLRGVRLDEALRWLTSPEADVRDNERELIAASVQAREAELAEREAQRQLEIELQRTRAQNAEHARGQLRIMLAGAGFFTLIAVILAILAVNQANAAQAARANAEKQSAAVQSLALSQSAQKALADHNPDLSLALALAAVKLPQPPTQPQQTLAEIADGVATIRQFDGFGDWVSSVAYSPDGKTALSGSYDNTLRLWTIASGQQLQVFKGHTDHVSSVAFSPDGKTALSGSWDTTLILWDVASGQSLRTFKGHRYPVSSVAFSPDGKTALSSSWDTTLILWDVASGQPIRTFNGHTDRISSVVFSPDGKTALSSSWDSTLILWNVASGQPIRAFKGQGGQINSVAFSPDGKSALSGGDDRALTVWDVATGQILRRATGHSGAVLTVGFSPDGQTLVSGSADETIRLWDAASGQEMRRLDGHSASVMSVAYGRDARTLLSGSADNSVRLWDIESRRFVGHGLSVSSVNFSPDGKLALSGSADKTLIIWDVATGTALHRLVGHTDVVENAVFSPDGKTAVSASDDGLLILWDVSTGKEIRRFTGHGDWIANVVFSPDGKTVIASSGNPDKDASLVIYDVATGKELRRFAGHRDSVGGLDISADGKEILTGSWDKTLILWDAATGQIIQRFTGHKDKIWAVAFSPDNTTVLSGSLDRTLRLWDVATGKELRRFVGHTGGILSVAFSPDGKTALSGSEDHTMRLWDVATGKELRRFEGHTDKIWDVTFSPDGQIGLSASADATVRLWHLARSLGDLEQWIQDNRYLRDLSCGEREEYRIEPLCLLSEPTLEATTPAVTATPVSGLVAVQGINRGQIAAGGGQVWTYSGQAGDVVTILVNADKPANDSTDQEQHARGLLDVRVVVYGPDGADIAEADDTVTQTFRTTDAQIDKLLLPVTGRYQIEVRSFNNETSGPYSLTIEPPQPTAATSGF